MTRVVDFEARHKRRQKQNEAAADLRNKTVVHFPLDEVVEVLVAMSEPKYRSLAPEEFRAEVRRRLPGISDDQVRNTLPAAEERLAELERQRRKIDYPLGKIASVIGAVVRSTRRYTTWPERQAEIRRRLPEITDGQIAEGLAVAQAQHEARPAARKEQNAIFEASMLRAIKLLGEFGITVGELDEVSNAAGDPSEDELRRLLEERFGPPKPFSLVEAVGNPGAAQ